MGLCPQCGNNNADDAKFCSRCGVGLTEPPPSAPTVSVSDPALAEQEDPFSQRVMFPAVHGFTTRIMSFMPHSLVARVRKWLVISDSSMPLPTFMFIVLVTTTLFPALTFAGIWAGSDGSPGRALWLVPIVAVFGFIAVVLASVNIFGGFAVTERMLAMFKKRG